jgi:cobalt-zinc-cadmium efflux system outer membrane protein
MRRIVLILAGAFVLVGTLRAQGEQPSKTYDLPQLLIIALERAPVLAAAEATIKGSQGRLRSTQEYPNPELSAAAGPGRALGVPENRGTEESFRLSQPLEWIPKRSSRIRAAKQAVLVSDLERKDTVLRVTAGVSAAFYELLGAQRELALVRQILEAVGQLAETVRKRVAAGEAPKFERIRAEVELQRTTKEVERVRSRVAQVRAGLEAEVGGGLERVFEVVAEFPEGRADSSLETLLESAMRAHPQVQARERQQAERRELLAATRASRIPDISVFAGFDHDIDRESYRLGLSIPLPIWSQRQGAIAVATAATRRGDAELLQAQIDLRKGIIHAFEQYQIGRGQLELFRKGLLRQAQDSVEIARRSYEFGEASLLELIDAQRVAFQVTRDYHQAQVELALAITSLERLTGGLP